MSVIEFGKFQEKQKLIKELKEWQTRLALAYEHDWKDPSKQICHNEVDRLKALIKDDSIIDKIARLN